MSRVSISTAWDEAKATYAREKRLLVPVALGLMVLPLAVAGMLTGGEQTVEPRDLPTGASWLVILLALVTMVGNLAVARLALSRDESVGDALRIALRRLLPLLGAVLLLVIPIIFLLATALVMAGVDPDALRGGRLDTNNPGIATVILLSFVLLLVVGVRMLPMNVIASAETGGSVSILRRSWALTRGHFFKLLGFLLLFAIATLLISTISGIVAGVLVSLAGGGLEPMSLGALAMGLVQGLLNAVAAVLMLLMVVSIVRQLSAGESTVPHVR